MLFESSVLYGLKEYTNTLSKRTVSFAEFTHLARKADIPYALFFAPKNQVEENLKRKTDILLAGVTKDIFSMNSRGTVQLRDIELIVKDLLRKQSLLKKHDPHLPNNEIVSSLKGSRKSVEEQAELLRTGIGIDLDHIASLSKEKTFDYIASLLEEKNVFISQSTKAYMPQNIQNSVKFSGICVKDTKVPFIFLNNKDDSKSFEPAGRKVLTLILLYVCLSKAKFSALSYDEQSKDLINDIEFRIAEEILMSRARMKELPLDNLEQIKDASQVLSVTPSALIMRMRHVGTLGDEQAYQYLNDLRSQFALLSPPTGRSPKPINAFKKYNGVGYSKAIFRLIDSNKISRTDARRILFLNKAKVSFLETFRGSLQ